MPIELLEKCCGMPRELDLQSYDLCSPQKGSQSHKLPTGRRLFLISDRKGLTIWSRANLLFFWTLRGIKAVEIPNFHPSTLIRQLIEVKYQPAAVEVFGDWYLVSNAYYSVSSNGKGQPTRSQYFTIIVLSIKYVEYQVFRVSSIQSIKYLEYQVFRVLSKQGAMGRCGQLASCGNGLLPVSQLDQHIRCERNHQIQIQLNIQMH